LIKIKSASASPNKYQAVRANAANGIRQGLPDETSRDANIGITSPLRRKQRKTAGEERQNVSGAVPIRCTGQSWEG
jgi:hypothetical protein